LTEWDRTSLGTSFASPMTCGVLALLLEEFPTATPEEIRTLLLDRSTPSLVGLEDTLYGNQCHNRMLTNCQNLWDETTQVSEIVSANAKSDTTVVKGKWYRWRVRRTTGNLINGEWSETALW